MIYSAPSIYNQGGGGGGYKDGGALVDGDFIKVENNSVSSYDNTTRSDVNFYFEVNDGEVINSVVELTTTVNATIHVYIVQNGLFIPLGNVGGDTVNAGDDYNLTVVGNSFMLEVVTPSQAVPEAVAINGNIYPVLNVNGLLWLQENYKGDIEGASYGVNSGIYYYYIADFANDFNINGWRLPSGTEQTDLLNFCNNDYSTYIADMHVSMDGYRSNKTGTMSRVGEWGMIANKTTAILAKQSNQTVNTTGYEANKQYNLRLVYEL